MALDSVPVVTPDPVCVPFINPSGPIDTDPKGTDRFDLRPKIG
jgi:hypothetical protein